MGRKTPENKEISAIAFPGAIGKSYAGPGILQRFAKPANCADFE
jgi:hypothetical protein